MKYWSYIVAAVFSLPFAALAQSEDAPQQQPSLLLNLFFTLLPILLILWFFFIKNIRKIQTTSIDANRQHQAAVEKLLERIAKALEKRNGDGG